MTLIEYQLIGIVSVLAMDRHAETFSTNNIFHPEHLVMTEDGVVMGAMLETTDTCLLSECELYFDIWGKVAGTLSDKRRNE